MKKTIFIGFVIIIALIALTACQKQQIVTEEGVLSADKVDVIPDISISECLTQIKQTNSEMSNQDANDNCYTIEAVNKNDKSLCDNVSAGFRPSCLAQFE